jgi:hypothetical protein
MEHFLRDCSNRSNDGERIGNLFATGLGVLGLLGWRRKKATAG